VVSTVLHVALFAFLARMSPAVLRTPSYGPQPDIQLSLAPIEEPIAPSPVPLTAPQHAQSPAHEASHRDSTVALRPRAVLSAPTHAIPAPPRPVARTIPRPVPPTLQTQPAPAMASIPAAGTRAGSNAGVGGGGAGGGHGGAGPLPGDEARDGVRDFLRATVGCSHEEYLHLNTLERAACDRRVGRDARAVANLKVDALPSGKRAYYDAVQQAYQQMHDPRTPVDTSPGGASWTGQAGHGIGFGCKYGNCGVIAPQGAGTEESGIPRP